MCVAGVLGGCASGSQSSSAASNALPAGVASLALACTAPSQVIRDGVSKPRSIVFDSDGDLVVANASADNVTVYPAGKDAPSQTIESGAARPNGSSRPRSSILKHSRSTPIKTFT
jgi:hypothetical protein